MKAVIIAMDTASRRSSASGSAHSRSTAMTSPDQAPTAQDRTTNNTDVSDDDIWADSPPRSSSQHTGADADTTRPDPRPIPAAAVLSDLPTVRRRRMADGYRDGLSHSKAQVMQRGFDDGYPIGVQVAMRAGRILGILEGLLSGMRKSAGPGDEGDRARRQGKATEVERLLKKAREELGRSKLLDGLEEDVLMRNGGVLEGLEGVLGKWEAILPHGLVDENAKISEEGLSATDDNPRITT
jgi:hypothetical protein